jgi:hypothetical protein
MADLSAFDRYSEIPLYRLACCRHSFRFGESFFEKDPASGARRDNLEENAAARVSKEGIDAPLQNHYDHRWSPKARRRRRAFRPESPLDSVDGD